MAEPDVRNVLEMWNAPSSLGEDASSLDVDVTPPDLLELKNSYLGRFLDEIDRQWPQGRDPSGNGHGTRVGTVAAYFDHAEVLHMHFRVRGTPGVIQREGVLKEVPVGHLESYNINPVFNRSDTTAEKVGEMLVSLPEGVDPNDPRWEAIGEILAGMS